MGVILTYLSGYLSGVMLIESNNLQASLVSVLVPAEQTTSEIVGHVHEQKYLEATVLQELEDVMAQVKATKMYFCFVNFLFCRLFVIGVTACMMYLHFL